MTITTEMLTRNIAKSGEVLNWNGFSPFQLHLGLIRYHSQSASCHIAIRFMQTSRQMRLLARRKALIFWGRGAPAPHTDIQ